MSKYYSAKMNRYFEKIKSMNFILISICSSSFFYQVHSIVHQYMLGKTVVNVEVKSLTSETLPAITICVPAFLSMSKLSESNQGINGIYQD